MILDAFAGPGGWDEGLRLLGETDVVGIEWSHDACRTATAAGHRRIRADVETFPLQHLRGRVTGLIMSPPCPDFSTAGSGKGVEGKSGRLIMQVPRWAKELAPEWIACEQVPPALPWWQHFAQDLMADGYRTWTGIVNAADLGVPQTRRRAILLASQVMQPQPPASTHTSNPQPNLFGETLQPWVTMASALGWGTSERPFSTVTGGDFGGSQIRAKFQSLAEQPTWIAKIRGETSNKGNTFNASALPARTLTSKVESWLIDRRSTGQRDYDASLLSSHTVLSSTAAWHVKNTARERTDIRISVQDALILQSFRRDYPVYGTKTSQYLQVGNSVPPLVAAHVLAQFVNPGWTP